MTQKIGRPRGRPKGAKNKRTAQRNAAMEAAAEQIEAAIPGAFEGDAHALLMIIYKDPRQDLSVRLDAAKAAIAFEKPRLAAVEPQRAAGEQEAPLAERVRAYTRRVAIEKSTGKVVELITAGTRITGDWQTP